jgi:hypothetical protein
MGQLRGFLAPNFLNMHVVLALLALPLVNTILAAGTARFSVLRALKHLM